MIGNPTQEEIPHTVKLAFNSPVMGKVAQSSFKFVIMEEVTIIQH